MCSTFQKVGIALLAASSMGVQPTSESSEVTVPVGTKIYCELHQRVISKKNQFQVGDKVHVRVWRDVVVDGQIAIPRGSLVDARISFLKKSKFAGVKGKLEIEATDLILPDGREIPLSGGYNKHGKGRKALSISLGVIVAWPVFFVKGKSAVLEPGTLFDAYTDAVFTIAPEASRQVPRLDLSKMASSRLEVEVLYDELEGQEKPRSLPLRVTVCDKLPASPLVIDRINGELTDSPVSVEVGRFEQQGACSIAAASTDLKPLVKQFRRGINRFDVAFREGDERISTEVVLDIQI